MSTQIQGRYHGQAGPLFGLYIKTALLTLITLGVYRFWAKTRIRKYIWSATSGDGDSFEYTGTGLEKLLGFLIAVVILAIYLGVIQMLLFFFGIFLFDEPRTTTEVFLQLAGFYITFFALLPLIFFAQYRARRYRMARTRWRGLRFGMDAAALGYVWRAIGHLLLTIVTLGILIPRQTFYLEKYMVDRTWYGDAKFSQEGRWAALYKGMKHLLFALIILAIGITLGVVAQSAALATITTLVFYVWFMVGLIYYRINAFNYLTNHKTLDAKVLFDAVAKTGTVVQIYVVGLLIIVGMAIVAGIIFAIAIGGLVGFGAAMGNLDPNTMDNFGAGIGVFSLILVIVLYLGLLLAFGGVALVMITQKIIEHMVNSVTVHNADHLDTIRQRAADTGADAEGFADALDIGAAI